MREIAEQTQRPVEEVVLNYLRQMAASLPSLPANAQAELDALAHLSDDALWTIAQEQIPQEIQQRAETLMRKNTRGTLSSEEHAELNGLVERSERLMLRKAEAAALLRERGHTFRQNDFRLHDD